MRLGRQTFVENCSEPRLAHAGLTRDEHDLTFALPCCSLAIEQKVDFLLAADEASQPRGMSGLEPALRGRYPLNCPGLDRVGKALDLAMAKVAQPEHIPQQTAGRGGDDDRPPLSQPLESGGKVRRITDYRLLL